MPPWRAFRPSQIFFGSRTLPSIVALPLDLLMQPWQVAVISRAKHELSAVCLAFLAEMEQAVAEIGLPKGGAKRVKQSRH